VLSLSLDKNGRVTVLMQLQFGNQDEPKYNRVHPD
jgi:hypothetical protein